MIRASGSVGLFQAIVLGPLEVSQENILRIFRLGITEEMTAWEKKRGTLLNRIVWYFLAIGIVTSVVLWVSPAVPREIAGYITGLALSYIGLLVLNSKGYFNITAIYIVFAGDLATCSAPVLVGLDSHAQFLLLLISGLPFILFHRDWGLKRLYMALMVLPMWIALEIYCRTHEPIFDLEPWLLDIIGYFYGAIVLGFSIYIFYHFTRQNERYADRIKRQRDQLDDKNKRLEQFSYMATHDLKTPVANIEGFYELLQMDLEDPDEEVQESLQGIGQSIEQAKTTIHDLIDVIQMVNRVEQVEPLDMDELMLGIEDGLSLALKEHQVNLKADFSECNTVYFGKVGLRSILQNLITNAIKYHSPKRKPLVEVKTQLKGDEVVLSVRDNGLGIDMEKDGEKLFSMFKRIHTDAEGTGMGLFVIKSMVEDRGGRIEVESQLDKGTTFFVTLPRIIIS